MRIRYSPRATRDLEAIYEYVVKRSPRGGANVMAAIFASVEFIRRNPKAAPAVSNLADVSAVVVHRYL
jgi:plasmid stabilization system protein ParE